MDQYSREMLIDGVMDKSGADIMHFLKEQTGKVSHTVLALYNEVPTETKSQITYLLKQNRNKDYIIGILLGIALLSTSVSIVAIKKLRVSQTENEISMKKEPLKIERSDTTISIQDETQTARVIEAKADKQTPRYIVTRTVRI